MPVDKPGMNCRGPDPSRRHPRPLGAQRLPDNPQGRIQCAVEQSNLKRNEYLRTNNANPVVARLRLPVRIERGTVFRISVAEVSEWRGIRTRLWFARKQRVKNAQGYPAILRVSLAERRDTLPGAYYDETAAP